MTEKGALSALDVVGAIFNLVQNDPRPIETKQNLQKTALNAHDEVGKSLQ
jgi:hypothetical protein